LIYPLAMTGAAQLVFPYQSQGSLIEQGGKTVGSVLIGQAFTEDKYFHGRPSATTAPDPNDASKTVAAPYNAANSGGSNLGPTSKALADRLQQDVAKLKAENPSASVPVDLVTASGSGLDPDISPEAVGRSRSRAGRSADGRAPDGMARRATCERAAAQSRPRPKRRPLALRACRSLWPYFRTRFLPVMFSMMWCRIGCFWCYGMRCLAKRETGG
jgi:K+-transporting ATPase KdpC subunit